ncbi:hypothetical protein [Nonomuraea sp. NPDC049141]|uniref:hypothetical protein n=1 Tax=unclassified Nonomuraea TaxID=2593643 RepID=UPI00340E1923
MREGKEGAEGGRPPIQASSGARRQPSPREVFLGSHLYWQNHDLLWEPVSRSDLGEENWLHLAYADKTLVTQIDGLGAAAATTQ